MSTGTSWKTRPSDWLEKSDRFFYFFLLFLSFPFFFFPFPSQQRNFTDNILIGGGGGGIVSHPTSPFNDDPGCYPIILFKEMHFLMLSHLSIVVLFSFILFPFSFKSQNPLFPTFFTFLFVVLLVLFYWGGGGGGGLHVWQEGPHSMHTVKLRVPRPFL